MFLLLGVRDDVGACVRMCANVHASRVELQLGNSKVKNVLHENKLDTDQN